MAQLTFNCDTCSASFISEDLLAEHHEAVHSGAPEAFVCQFCNESFAIAEDREAHEQQIHTARPANAVPCPECGVTMPSPEVLEEHLATNHPTFQGMARGT